VRSAQHAVGDDLEQGAHGGRVEVAVVGDRGDATDEAAHLHGLDVLAQGVLLLQPVDHALGRRLEDLALGDDRRALVAHGAGDLGRPALVHADQPDVGLEPRQQQVAGVALVDEHLVDRVVHPVHPALHDRVHQDVAAREVPVERAGADTRALGHLVERGVIPLLAEDLTGGLDQPVPVALRVGAHGHLTCQAESVSV
jgi:hypothetical protein